MLNVSVVIPFYHLPDREWFHAFLVSLLMSEIAAVVVVDDGSGGIYDGMLASLSGDPKFSVLKHGVNAGKGAAIKAGLNYVYCKSPECAGAVVVHANERYRSEDVLALARELERSPGCLIQGVSQSSGGRPSLPEGGDAVFGFLFRLFTGADLQDVTTGMRVIPRSFMPLCLKIRSNYYEFDMDLVLLCKYNNVSIRRIPITLASDIVRRFRFNPILDSMKIGFVFFRFFLVSLFTAFIDFMAFILMYGVFGHIIVSIVMSRMVAMVVNYRLIKTRVFYSSDKDYRVLSKYVLLALCLGGISCTTIMALVHGFSMNVFLAKAIVETGLFLLNFLIQRDFIFVTPEGNEKTNWDLYYEKPYVSARMTRKIMGRRILDNIKKNLADGGRGAKVMELGGANSCFLDAIREEIKPAEYHVVDNNEIGLDKLRERVAGLDNVYLYNKNILHLDMPGDMDLSFSAGLIEHFSTEGTMAVVKSHFDAVKPGGLVLLTFPTSTWLYHFTRFWAVLMGLWIFNDERPLTKAEVVHLIDRKGKILHQEVVWPVFLTQMIIVARKY